MPTPSLILVPARFKTGKLYTPVATTSGGLVLGASGDFNVTRATTATRVNASGFIEVVASGIPRLDYPLGGGCPALLVEPAATNSNPNSNTFSVETAPVATVVQNQVDPFGNPNSAWLMSGADSASDSASANNVRILQSGLASNIYTCSIYVKSPTGSPVTFRYRQTAGGVISGSAVVSGSGFQRIQLTSPNTDTSSRFIIYTTGGEPIIISCHQVEVGPVATSYIPTTTAAVTRNADVVTLSGAVSGCIGQTEGTMYAEVDMQRLTLGSVFVLDVGGTGEYIAITKLATGAFRVSIKKTSTSAVNIITTTTNAVGVYKLALGYKSGDYALYINGVSRGTSTNSTDYPTGALIQSVVSNTNYGAFNDCLRTPVALYTTRLTNAELAALTT